MNQKQGEKQKTLNSIYTHPPISHGNILKQKESIIKKILSEKEFLKFTSITNKRIQKKFLKNKIEGNSPKETKFNHSMVGLNKKQIKKVVTPSLYNPHNYRLYLKFTKEKYHPKEGMVGVWFGKLKNYGKEFTALGEGIRVTVKKVQVELINKLSEEEWFYINRAKAKEEIAAILNKIDDKCITALKKFIEVYGGKSDFKIIKTENRPNLNLFTSSDNKVMQEPYIDTLPLNMTFDTKIVKKVYKKANVEYKQPIYAATHLENSALHEFAPEIANSINDLGNHLIPSIRSLDKSIQLEITNKKLHMKVLHSMDKTLKDIRESLPKRGLLKWL